MAETDVSVPATIEEVSISECLGTMPADGATCARSSNRWQLTDPNFCGGGEPCYQHAEVVDIQDLLAEAERALRLQPRLAIGSKKASRR